MRNFGEGIDVLVNVGLDGLPTAGKLYVFLVDDAEAALTAGDGIASLTQTALTATKSVTGLSCVNRVVDLGAFQWSELVGSPKAVVCATAAPSDPAAKAVFIQNINGGSVVDLATVGPYACDGLSFLVAYEGEV